MPAFAPYSLFRRFLWIPKARKWYDKLHSPGRLLGAPVTDEKLWHHFKRQSASFATLWLAPLTRWYRRNAWVKFRSVGVRVRVQTIKPVKPARKFIVTLTRLPRSVQAAERCIASAKRHGEHRGLEIAPAVDKFQAQDFFVRHGFTWYHLDCNAELGKDPLPEMGCFASHYQLWQRCVELGEPIIILEHDAVLRSAIPPLRFKHVILLSKLNFRPQHINVDVLKTFRCREIFYPLERLAAAHCYAITPAGARILVAAAQRQLTIPADDFINKSRLDILYYHPYLADSDSAFSTIDARHPDSPTPEEVWQSYKRSP